MMAQQVRGSEILAFPSGTATTRKRASRALARLAERAAKDEDAAAFAATLLESIAEVAERHEAPAALSREEQALWEGLGASFSDAQSVATRHAKKAAAFADLLGRSVKGDAAVAKLLEVDRSRVSQRVSERSLFAVPGPDDRYFPRWQFEGKKVVRGLRAILSALEPDLHPLTVDQWCTTPNLELVVDDDPMSPVMWLATGGEINTVVELAADV